MSVNSVELSALGSLTQLGDGGEGVVYRASKVPGQVYKEYKSVVAHEVNPRGLEATIGILPQLSESGRSFVAERSAWPHTLVQRNGSVTGFLMQEIPAEFSCQHGMAGRPRTVLNDWNKLVTRDDWMDKANIESTVPRLNVKSKQDEKVILGLLLDLASFFSHLHDRNVVVGDVSGRNILWTTNPQPTVFLIDCDGFRVQGDRAVTSSKQSPDWFDPHLTGDTTLDSDRFKLATAIYRAYFSDAFGTPSEPKKSGGPNGAKILALAQQGTTALQWCELLEEIKSGRPRRLWSPKWPKQTSNPITPDPGRQVRPWNRRTQ
jgi:hypothetical protein